MNTEYLSISQYVESKSKLTEPKGVANQIEG
jgi:hypothetical protein